MFGSQKRAINRLYVIITPISYGPPKLAHTDHSANIGVSHGVRRILDLMVTNGYSTNSTRIDVKAAGIQI